jgi:excisionase family DNA binding protein
VSSNLPPEAEDKPGPDRLLTPQDVADLIGTWLEAAAPRFLRGKTAGVQGRLLTTREVAKLLNVSPHTVTRWASEGKLPAIRLPGTAHGRLRFREDELAEWIESRSTTRG